MPTVQLEYKVIETGPKVSQVVGDAEKSLARLKDAGGGAGKGLDFMTVSSERASLSFRTLNRGVNDMAAALGASHPEIANIALGLGHVAERIASVGLSAGLMGGLVIAAGAGVAALMKWTERTDEAIEFQVRLNHSVQEFDTSGMIAQLKKVGEELEILQEKAKAGMRGTNLPVITSTGVEALYGDIEGGPVTAGQALAEKQIKDLQERQKKISEELERIAPLSFEKQLIEITSKIHAAQSAPIPSGGPTSAWAEQTTAYLKQDEAAAKRLLDLQKQVAMGQAASEEERARVSILSAFQRVAVEETTTAKITAVQTALAEHQKALADQEIALKKETAQKWLALTDQQLGKAQAEYQKYSEQVKALETQMAASKAGTADVLAGIKQAGMTPAEAFADREKRAQQALAEAMKRSGQ